MNQSASSFAPDNVTVVIGTNNTVIWTNNDTVSHTVVSLNIPSGAQNFTSPIIKPGGNYTQTLTVAGTYKYYCSLHHWMIGYIIVMQGTSKPALPVARTVR